MPDFGLGKGKEGGHFGDFKDGRRSGKLPKRMQGKG